MESSGQLLQLCLAGHRETVNAQPEQVRCSCGAGWLTFRSVDSTVISRNTPQKERLDIESCKHTAGKQGC